jgi:hypothetical protein
MTKALGVAVRLETEVKKAKTGNGDKVKQKPRSHPSYVSLSP